VSASRRRAAVALVVGATVAALAGCGIDTDDEPRAIPRSNVPEGLLDDELVPDAPSSPGSGPTREVSVQFIQTVDDEVRLVRVPRSVPRPVTEANVLDALLLQPPTERERDDNIATAIQSGTKLASPPSLGDGGVLVIDLSGAFFDVQGEDLRNAYAQVVCTATELESVTAVLFEVDGRPRTAVDGNLRETNGPMSCSDYDNLTPDGEG
jgi:spore germination protein GerM